MRRAFLVTLVWCAPAFAWESVCYDSAGHGCNPAAGPETTKQRWIGPLDEHRQLFANALQKAGVPSEVNQDHSLVVFVGAGTGLSPVSFEQTLRAPTRVFTPAELAQLPDFSYALWDWASGNEQCPLSDGTDAVLCHDFASHMGPVNSSHFAPQAGQFYARYHALALARAAECKTMADALQPTQGRFDDFTKQCEVEALSLEAVGQHYLQDAWSMGHMWQRWGSSQLSDFPGANTDEQRDHAVLVALAAGFIHGARGVLQALPGWTSLDVDDALCAPWDDVQYVSSAGSPTHGVGDDYLSQLKPEQSQQLYDCATSGILEVYRATGRVHGNETPDGSLNTVDPTSDVCFSQRATNAALVRGMAIQTKLAGVQLSIPIDARFSSWLIPQVARASGKVPVEKPLKNQFRLSLQRVTTIARIAAKDDPNGTSMAEGGLGDLVGVHPNGQYALAPDYMDPPVPWNPAASPREAWLTRTFHRAHAAQWCGVDATALKAHAQDVTLDAPSKLAACLACSELVQRQLRIGTAQSWDVGQEPICTYLTTAPTYVYVAGPGQAAPLAQTWCCP